MEGFKRYLRKLGLCEKSVEDDMSRIKSMIKRNIDYTKGEEYVRQQLQNSNLSCSTIDSCRRLCKRYKEYLNLHNK